MNFSIIPFYRSTLNATFFIFFFSPCPTSRSRSSSSPSRRPSSPSRQPSSPLLLLLCLTLASRRPSLLLLASRRPSSSTSLSSPHIERTNDSDPLLPNRPDSSSSSSSSSEATSSSELQHDDIESDCEPGANWLIKQCLAAANPSVVVNIDPETSSTFDNQYYNNLLAHKGIFQSDSVLFEDPRTRKLVEEFANDQERFFQGWSQSFTKLVSIGVKMDEEGEIQRSCSVTNA